MGLLDYSEKDLTIEIGERPVKGKLQGIIYNEQVMKSDAEKWEERHRTAQSLLSEFRDSHPELRISRIIKTEQWPGEMVKTLARVLKAKKFYAPIYVGGMIAEFPISEAMTKKLMWILESNPEILFHSPEKEIYG